LQKQINDTGNQDLNSEKAVIRERRQFKMSYLAPKM